jgi:serine/threonine-protein kinase
MDLPVSGSPLPPSSRRELEKILYRFEDAWRTGTPPRLDDFCPPRAGKGNDPARLLLLRELIKIDLEYRWKQAGNESGAPRSSPLEAYCERYSELRDCEQLLLEVVGAEYRVRHLWCDRPQHAEYLARFGRQRPNVLDALRRVDAELAAEIVREGRPPVSDRATATGPYDGKRTVPSSITSVPSLLDTLREHHFLTPAQLQQLDLGNVQIADPRALARHIMERGWLTPYQINQLFLGRAAELVVGPYLLLERLGEGGAGQVYKARHLHMGRIVALKLIRKEMLNEQEVVGRFQREVHALSKLTHPHVVHAYDAGPIGANFFLAMEYLEGIDLSRLVKQKQPLAIAQACDYVWQTALGLQHLHEHGLVHRDIKPSNLLVTGLAAGASVSAGGLAQAPAWGVVKILDLGLARWHRPIDEVTAGLTAPNALLMGTLDYMAPEQALDFHQVDIRADIYSLGCTFYYLLTGRPPFPDCTLAQKLHRHQTAEPMPVEQLRGDVPSDLLPVLRKMMAKRPQDRYQLPGEIAQLLSPILHGPAASEGAARPLVVIAPSHGALLPATVCAPVARLPTAGARVPQTEGRFGQSLRQVLLKWSPFRRHAGSTQRRPLVVPALVVLLLAGLLLLLFLFRGSSRPAEQFYLSDMRPEKIVGRLTIDGKTPAGGLIVVNGSMVKKSLYQGGEPTTPQVSYRLGKQFKHFKAQAALLDSTGHGGDRSRTTRFVVKGDGRVLWESRTVANAGALQDIDVLVEGVEQLDLIAILGGSLDTSHAIWVDPYLTK